MKSSYKPAEDALKNLSDALLIQNPSDLERDGSIQRFEYCYELIWKLAQRILKDNEINADSPRTVFRELGKLGWINNVEDWLEFQRMRNETSHEYGEKLAKDSYQLAKRFLPLAISLLNILRVKSQ